MGSRDPGGDAPGDPPPASLPPSGAPSCHPPSTHPPAPPRTHPHPPPSPPCLAARRLAVILAAMAAAALLRFVRSLVQVIPSNPSFSPTSTASSPPSLSPSRLLQPTVSFGSPLHSRHPPSRSLWFRTWSTISSARLRSISSSLWSRRMSSSRRSLALASRCWFQTVRPDQAASSPFDAGGESCRRPGSRERTRPT
jgi:hypothetical protein